MRWEVGAAHWTVNQARPEIPPGISEETNMAGGVMKLEPDRFYGKYCVVVKTWAGGRRQKFIKTVFAAGAPASPKIPFLLRALCDPVSDYRLLFRRRGSSLTEAEEAAERAFVG